MTYTRGVYVTTLVRRFFARLRSEVNEGRKKRVGEILFYEPRKRLGVYVCWPACVGRRESMLRRRGQWGRNKEPNKETNG